MPGSPYVKFRDSSSRAAEAASPRPAGASAAIRSGSRLQVLGLRPRSLPRQAARLAYFLQRGAGRDRSGATWLLPPRARQVLRPPRPGPALPRPGQRGLLLSQEVPGGEPGGLRPPRRLRSLHPREAHLPEDSVQVSGLFNTWHTLLCGKSGEIP